MINKLLDAFLRRAVFVENRQEIALDRLTLRIPVSMTPRENTILMRFRRAT